MHSACTHIRQAASIVSCPLRLNLLCEMRRIQCAKRNETKWEKTIQANNEMRERQLKKPYQRLTIDKGKETLRYSGEIFQKLRVYIRFYFVFICLHFNLHLTFLSCTQSCCDIDINLPNWKLRARRLRLQTRQLSVMLTAHIQMIFRSMIGIVC